MWGTEKKDREEGGPADKGSEQGGGAGKEGERDIASSNSLHERSHGTRSTTVTHIFVPSAVAPRGIDGGQRLELKLGPHLPMQMFMRPFLQLMHRLQGSPGSTETCQRCQQCQRHRQPQ